ncbi:tetratricopeptide repeat protein [Schleiferilactobacillus shenzhenensis]|uniref:Tetratricopeptide repeat protein n=1 Tax=Schleiferilactobacillus shenzhenensis LY-73 TaxID=1231336 RepID=U4TYV9_9LACO|nr:tetratricopeptide repeat protein [Schleiferilactobacillus shenzhenensis]ERL66497.1 hypothetical protein L248_0176 [Schleiferilactobacillus shenzhenensis LY-73]
MATKNQPALTDKDRVAARVHALVQQIDQNPRDKKAMIALAHLLVQQGAPDQAAALLTKGLAVLPGDDLLQYNLAAVAVSQGDAETAQKLLAQVHDPALAADKAYTTAQLYFAQKQYPRALAFALTAVDHAPNDAQYQLLYGDILSALENWPLAVQALQQAAALAPAAYKPHFDLGVALLGQGDTAGAKAALARARHLDPARYQQQAALFRDIGRLVKGGPADDQSAPSD